MISKLSWNNLPLHSNIEVAKLKRIEVLYIIENKIIDMNLCHPIRNLDSPVPITPTS